MSQLEHRNKIPEKSHTLTTRVPLVVSWAVAQAANRSAKLNKYDAHATAARPRVHRRNTKQRANQGRSSNTNHRFCLTINPRSPRTVTKFDNSSCDEKEVADRALRANRRPWILYLQFRRLLQTTFRPSISANLRTRELTWELAHRFWASALSYKKHYKVTKYVGRPIRHMRWYSSTSQELFCRVTL